MPIWNQYPSLLSPQDPVQYSTILSSLHIIYFHLNLRLHSFWAEGNPRRRRPKTSTNTQDPRPILHNIAFTWVGFGNCRRSKLVRTKMLSLFTLNSDNQNDKNPKWKRHINSQSNRWHQKYSTVRSKNFRKLRFTNAIHNLTIQRIVHETQKNCDDKLRSPSHFSLSILSFCQSDWAGATGREIGRTLWFKGSSAKTSSQSSKMR